MEQPVPDVTGDDVERIVRRDFAPNEISQVESLLQGFPGELSPRVALAVLKLSDSDLAAVPGNLEVARMDWRDVIANAEYPGYMSKVPGAGSLSDAQRNEIVRSDWDQYFSWLSRSPSGDP